ncbi:MAG: hypothetical protein WBD40_23155 [Tepidisphaeraceae bacterium]
MSDLAATAQQLRHVKEATRNFLTLFALEQMRDRVRQGRDQIEELDTAAIEAAILELDVYDNPQLVRGVLEEK